MMDDQRESQGFADRVQGALTWIVAVVALLIVVSLVVFFIADLGPFCSDC